MNNDDDEDASLINPLTPEVVIKQIGNSIDGGYEFEIMESTTTTNESTNKSKKRKANTANEDFF